MAILGIDIGGSGIKGAPVEIGTGQLLSPRFRIPTPEDAKPKDVAKVVREIVDHFAFQGKIGVGFPAVVVRGTAYSAANIHESWIGTNIAELLNDETGCKTRVINDADAAGLAEMTFGAGKDYIHQVVLLLTIGTGIGSAVFINGHLLPNTEFGHIEIRGKDAELRASDATRQRKELSWKKWSSRFNEYLEVMERLISPDIIIIGGGISKNFQDFGPYIKARARLLPALLLNNAGIVGAALATELEE